jgi:D-aspartate ligase
MSLQINNTIKPHCAVILGGYVNGYNIIRELHEKGVRDIVLLDHAKRLASRSNKISAFRLIEKNDSASLLAALSDIHKQYDYLVLFPSEDAGMELLAKEYKELKEFCFIPFNPNNISQYSDKRQQYLACEALSVPYPKTESVNTVQDIEKIYGLPFPVVIKPGAKKVSISSVFRSLRFDNSEDVRRHHKLIAGFIEQGASFLVSEVIPGDGSNIYSYMGYRTRDGRILNEWVGRKLSQYPNDFGVFASASNECPDIVAEQGRALLHGMDLWGIAQPEFKYDSRDGRYKLMEINLRSMMWNRVGNRSGVNIQFTQYLDALGADVPRQHQARDRIIHFVYLKHELENLLMRPGYLKVFRYNLFAGDERTFAVFDAGDLWPFFYDLKVCLRSCLSIVVTQKILRCLTQCWGVSGFLKKWRDKLART